MSVTPVSEPIPEGWSDPPTFKDWLRYCLKYQEEILITYVLYGKRGSYPISQIPLQHAIALIYGWYLNGHIPHRAKEPNIIPKMPKCNKFLEVEL